MSLVAAVQMVSGPDVDANLREAQRLIGEAAAAGAELVALPENFAHMGLAEIDKLALREPEGHGPLQEFLAGQAARHGVWLVGGTIPLAGIDSARVRAACLLFDPHGRRVARYDKMHLFDVQLPSGAERYAESQTIEPGDEVVVADTPFGRLGLAVCYDLRFPELFRSMLDRGVELLAVPSAFTATTGAAHWETLVRVRAIENLCYVIASAQGGYHVNGRETHGDSMIVDPWGTVLERLPRGPGVVCAPVDRDRLAEVRRSFPALAHRRLQCAMTPRAEQGEP
ncbi:MAG: carbon-nitrogen hydrolase family protein [Gammaproteobacteria bacterium]|nr:carbon-nitrogen hydrolase family protein [Gammaproteobacteria bacterium]